MGEFEERVETELIRRGGPPLYRQLKGILARAMAEGVWKPGEMIPGEQALQRKYKLSRTTVRQALQELVTEGLVTRCRGRGTFVKRPARRLDIAARDGLTEELRAQCTTLDWRVLASARVPAPAEVAARLGLVRGGLVTRIERVHVADGQVIGLHLAHLSSALRGPFPSERLLSGDSLEFLRAAGVVVRGRVEARIEAILADEREVRRLGVDAGTPMLRINRALRGADGAVIATLVASYRGEHLHYDLTRGLQRTALSSSALREEQ